MTGFLKRLHEANQQAFDWVADELSVVPGHAQELGDLFNDLILHNRRDDGIVTGDPTVTPLDNPFSQETQEEDPYSGIEIGFPEGQLLPHCNGNTDLCGELTEIFYQGEEFPDTDDDTLNAITSRLQSHSRYGAFKNVYGSPLNQLTDDLEQDWQIGTDLTDDIGHYG